MKEGLDLNRTRSAYYEECIDDDGRFRIEFSTYDPNVAIKLAESLRPVMDALLIDLEKEQNERWFKNKAGVF